jgi:hypothetical protein
MVGRHVMHKPTSLELFKDLRFEILTLAIMKISFFWDIMPCSQLTFSALHIIISQKIELFQRFIGAIQKRNYNV